MSLEEKTLAIIGGGKMGEAILKGVLDSQTIGPRDIIVSEKIMERRSELYTKYHISILDDNKKAVEKADIIILAVKPQQRHEVFKEISQLLDRNKLFISIMAGVSTNTIAKELGEAERSNFEKEARIVRAMPNICAIIGESATGICKGKFALPEDVEIAKGLFSACGKVMEVGEEDKMHAITGLSGSGVAYFFEVIDALTEAGVREGLPAKDARFLVAQTALGAAKVVLETGKHPAELKEMVTSPAGTTIEGLYELESCGVRAAFMEAVRAAVNRSKDLGGEKKE